ncbi:MULTISPECIES: type II toxin-antitoxin system VapC family toxin [unclassified Chelatococcus]|uniref:type II toxin-antitoxin system VapC family toxin n=1 Tax=unclassified Chelatococcus TaxID=2638111 RepID=UPI001BD0F59D|nr:MULTISPECIES: type II toxin-antitoxin system VapC family toxin [unclassified Chelatococcus]MBS7700178.1 type II toxin-antitoxin system VapC family toxin [Chelatococcus sp. YT9]MBX3556871.1 type II toxin-antitoxin system VapC family toxin [Chelatococcus sp.]
MYLLETGVIVDARRGDPRATAWLRSVDPSAVYLSVLTIGAIMRGIAYRQTSDPAGAAPLAEWLRGLRHRHADRILPVTDQIAMTWGRLAGTGVLGSVDGLIAATAIVHDLILVTQRGSAFSDIGASVVDPRDANLQG